MDMAKSIRRFRLLKFGLVSDLTKFYNQIILDQESFPFSLIVWRHNGDPSEPAVIHLLTRLMYGLSCSGFLSEKGLMLIGDTAIKNCTICLGNDTNCSGIAHEFYEMLESSYVDDLPYSVDTEERN